jgi:hypothetical protein
MLAAMVGLTAALSGFLLVQGTMPSADVVLEPPAAPPAPASVAAAEPETPVTFAAVIDLSDLDPLLDPPAKPVDGAPFEADGKPAPESPAPAPDRIPSARE